MLLGGDPVTYEIDRESGGMFVAGFAMRR